ncbi:tyrosine-type recombinase/integrase [Rhodoferax mekongensis]|uniref:tyrosine-type recombinase/integrase n=1 Tax=Rhodoferax mekongensis TaxID=3068341 RepID=UPI0028BDAE01|nr:site-specific integrase [Rhodoferax sp. TBRC 17199]MDT7514675.1 site-specific integrase [Rhodoferax sp. TBRC 17199]
MVDSHLAPAEPSSTDLPQKRKQPAKVINFDDETIKGIKPPTEVDRVEYKDSKVSGLYLRVSRTGVKSFSFVGRAKNAAGSERQTIGKYPIIKPAQARAKARELAGIHATGESITAPGWLRRQEMTVSDLWDEYYKHISKYNKDPEGTKAVWDTYIKQKWGNYRLSDVQPIDVEGWHTDLPSEILKRRAQRAAEIAEARLAKRAEIEARRKVRKHGPDPKPRNEEAEPASKIFTGQSTANRALATLRALYNFGMASTRQYFTGVNPAKDHKKYRERERQRFLLPRELGPFFAALANEPNETIRDAILVALLTAQRRSNVFAMQWSHISLQDATWAIPGEQTKNGEQYVVTLLPELVSILEQRLELRPRDEKGRLTNWVFPSSKGESGHIVDVRKAWARILKSSGLTNLILHDLRRTLASWQMRTGTSLLMISKSLNHKSMVSTQIYTQVDRDPIRESLERASSAMFATAGLTAPADVHSLNPESSSAGWEGRSNQTHFAFRRNA